MCSRSAAAATGPRRTRRTSAAPSGPPSRPSAARPARPSIVRLRLPRRVGLGDLHEEQQPLRREPRGPIVLGRPRNRPRLPARRQLIEDALGHGEARRESPAGERRVDRADLLVVAERGARERHRDRPAGRPPSRENGIGWPLTCTLGHDGRRPAAATSSSRVVPASPRTPSIDSTPPVDRRPIPGAPNSSGAAAATARAAARARRAEPPSIEIDTRSPADQSPPPGLPTSRFSSGYSSFSWTAPRRP